MNHAHPGIWEFSDRVAYLQQRIDALPHDGLLTALEAGCGSVSHLRFPDQAHLTGIDISQEQLTRNTMLHEKICADIHAHAFPEARFDLIMCWNVMEHLNDPIQVLRNFVRWLKPGGLIIIGTPNPYSAKGFVTKFTPHFVHVLLYRYVLGKKDAGQPGTEPFPTYLRWSLSPRSLKLFSRDHGLEIDTLTTYRTPWEANIRNPLCRAAWKGYTSLLAVFSLNQLDVHHSETLAVLRKPD
ncbi:MAG: methyltransferase type 12 [Anaerolineaceae bacterium]|nr:methyltransferase type 12 [Anaerolineaceae bacterium]